MRHASLTHIAAAKLVLGFWLLAGTSATSADSLLKNGDFQKWKDGVPEGWELTIGAMNGAEEPKSDVQWVKGPALVLSGDVNTMAWHAVGQKIPARAGGRYRLEFESRTKDVKREGRQYDNCYVGVMCYGNGDNAVGREFQDVTADTADWTKHRVEFTVPQNATRTQVMIFLSKTGILGVRNVSVTATGGTPASPAATPPAEEETDAKTLVANGDFSKWTNTVPDSWKIDIGARNGGNDPKSKIERLVEGGMALQGDASTMAWHSLSQELGVQKGKTYTLTFEAQSEGIRKEGPQRYDNCYVGVMVFDASGNRAGVSTEDLSRVPRWKQHRIVFSVPPNAAKAELLIFLSKSGRLMVRNISVKEATSQRPFRGSRR